MPIPTPDAQAYAPSNIKPFGPAGVLRGHAAPQVDMEYAQKSHRPQDRQSQGTEAYLETYRPADGLRGEPQGRALLNSGAALLLPRPDSPNTRPPRGSLHHLLGRPRGVGSEPRILTDLRKAMTASRTRGCDARAIRHPAAQATLGAAMKTLVSPVRVPAGVAAARPAATQHGQ